MHIVIIGNGIAGVSTARHVRKISDHKITLVSSESKYFWSRPALMYVYMGHMKFEHTQPYENWFWEKNKINLLQQYVERINPQSKTLQLADGGVLEYDKLVLATGSLPNKFGWPGQDLEGVQGMVSKQELESMEAYSKDTNHAVIVGGGLIGIEMAEMFHSRHIPVTLLVREGSFWNNALPPEESQMVTREIQRTHGIDLRLETELKEILPDAKGRARSIITNKGEEIACQFVGLTAGVHANKSLAEGADLETNRGFLVNEFLETNVSDIFAVGDCAELRKPATGRRGVEAVWYTGKLMGPILAQTLCGNPTEYHQDVWFNSAKFLDIEYQVYGSVGNKVREGESHIYWEHPEGRHSIRLVYETASGNILGFNLMGVRYRQEVCQAWIRSETHVEEVLQNLGAANFDPEFFRQYEHEVVDQYNQQTGKQLTLKRKKGLKHAVAVLSKLKI